MKLSFLVATAGCALAVCGVGVQSADAGAPVLGREVVAGQGTTSALASQVDGQRRVDGDPADWGGTPTRFGGTVAYSHGELVYQDHIFDAYGADNGQDRQRLAVQDPLAEAVPETYRLDPAAQYVPQEFGIPTPGLSIATHYGDLEHQDQADLSELRAGTDRSGNLWLLGRTTTMPSPSRTALLVLLDTAPGPALARDVPFASGLRSGRAERALLLAGDRGWSADLATGAITELPAGSVATKPDAYVNAIEARVPASALGGALSGTPAIAAATGLVDGSGAPKLKDLGVGPSVANVAFRTHEPARDWWDKQQAFALFDGTIDPFFTPLDTARLLAGDTERYAPGPGYHDRLFDSSPAISEEKAREGVIQHYGVYLPTSYRPDRASPLQWWFHFRGGTAHIAAAVVPRIFQEMGEDRNTIVVTPRGRGTSTWYVGKGQVDYQEVYADVNQSFNVDADRTYIAGHSMGGWASYLLPILYPDRFAASFPASGPPTQGAFTGVDFDGCESVALHSELDNPCYTQANGSDPRAQYTGPLLDNLRSVPLAIYHGAADELVPLSGVARQAQILQGLGYRYRLYVFPGQEHYGPPIQDQWADGAAYEHGFVRDPNPARVTYVRSMPSERATERVSSGGVKLGFDFDKAYWMSGLTPVDDQKGVARFDGQSLAIGARPYELTPEAGGPATAEQSGPYAMTGQAWRYTGIAPPLGSNEFTARLSGASAVTVDTQRMRLSAFGPLTGRVDTAAPLTLTLAGPFGRATRGTLDGRPVDVGARGGSAVVSIPQGKHVLVLDQPARACASRRHFTIRLPRPRGGDRLVSARVLVNGKRVRTIAGSRLRAKVDLRGLPKGTYHVTVTGRTAKGRKVRQVRTYRTCVPRKP